MCKKILLLLVCILLMLLIGIDPPVADASVGLEENILVARADRDHRHDRHSHDHDEDDECDDGEEDDDDKEDWNDDEEEELEELLEEHAEDALEYLESIVPELYEHFVDDDEIRPQFIGPVEHFTRLWLEWEETGEKGVEFELKHFAMRFHVNVLVHEYHEIRNEKERKQIRAEIQGLLVDLFDFEIVRREYRVAEIQRELDMLKNEIQRAKSDKEGQIRAYLDKLTSTQTIFER